MWPLLIGAGVGLAGTLGSVYGQESTNRSNETIANNATSANMAEASRDREFQAAQVSAQQEFQERMANTAHQREQADLRAAGLNPMLTAKGVGANSPSGASASGAQGSAVTAKLDNPYASLGAAGHSAMDVMQAAAGLKKQAAETDYIRTQDKVAKKGIPRAEITNDAYDWVKKKLKQLEQSRAEAESVNRARETSERFRNPRGYDQKKKMFLY